jgi:GTP-binding protein
MNREKYLPKGGPDGGDGGRGGHLIIRGNTQMWTLLHLRYSKHNKAPHGGGGTSNQKTGAEGNDVYLDVPVGTIVRDSETNEVLFEIDENKQEEILMKGGRGGRGNTHFKTSTNQAPEYAQPGEEAQEGWVIMELKILADVGLVGFPNAGKSTLLSVVSAAKPEVANYAFTTLRPNLGMVEYRNNQSFVMADIPGIIEGAHEGKGLGLRFLRHIERNAALIFMVAADSKDINEEFNILLGELKQYNPQLLDKERILVISKSDMLDEELTAEIEKELPAIPHLFISSVTHYNIQELKDLIWKTLHA